MSRLIDRCCQVGKEKAVESSKFNCKLSARDALISSQPHRNLLALSAEQLLLKDSNFANQCEMVLESCCISHHRTKNCDSGKQFAKSGASCLDVELSKEATLATESFNDCCMSCSLGILAAKVAAQNETATGQSRGQQLANRCKLISPLASSLSGQLYEQTYNECCQENLPRVSGALVESGKPIRSTSLDANSTSATNREIHFAGAPIDCAQSNGCSQLCLPAGSIDPNSQRPIEESKCGCFSGYKLAADGLNCVDINECKLNMHTCNKQSEVCDNTRGSFRCLARTRNDQTIDDFSDQSVVEFGSLRLCPLGSRWNAEIGECQPTSFGSRSASLLADSTHLSYSRFDTS